MTHDDLICRRVSRRDFLRSTGALTLGLSLQSLLPLGCGSSSTPQPEARSGTAPPTPGAAHALPDYRTWEDVYRSRWQWDKVGRSSHFVNCWYQSHCAWNVYVKDGMVWREEQ